MDCHEVQNQLLPQLSNIFKQMVQMIITDVITLSDEVIKDVDKLSEVCVHVQCAVVLDIHGTCSKCDPIDVLTNMSVNMLC